MNRKLHNTLTALMVAGIALAAGFLAGSPATAPSTANGLQLAVAADNTGDEGERPAGIVRSVRARQSVAMPFFSFAPRG